MLLQRKQSLPTSSVLIIVLIKQNKGERWKMWIQPIRWRCYLTSSALGVKLFHNVIFVAPRWCYIYIYVYWLFLRVCSISFLVGCLDLALYVRQSATKDSIMGGWLVVGSPHPQVCPYRLLIEAPGSRFPRWPSLCVWHVSGAWRRALAGGYTDLHTVSVGQM